MKQTIGIIIGVGVLLGIGFIVASGQNQGQNSDEETGLAIATSFYPLAFALERIVGEHGTITNIGAGRDPHNFEPSTQDMVALKRADVVVLQGADFEPWGDVVGASLEADNVPVIIATSNIELHEGGHEHAADEAHTDEYEDEPDHDHGAFDPHTWLDPVLFSDMVGYLAQEIAVLDPNNTDEYISNAAALQTELASLHTQYENRLTNCALDEVITSHEAFGYLGDRYGFKVHAIAGLSTQDSPSATTLASLKEEAKEGIGAILLEENSITAYGETLARETGLQTVSLNPIAYSVDANETYVTLMQSNLDSFALALNCNE